MTDRYLRIALIVSLALNVFIVAAASGAAYMWLTLDREARSAATPRAGLRAAANGLSAERHTAFRQAVDQTRRDAQSLIAAARADRGEILQLLASPDFDRAAVDAAFARTRDADGAVRTRMEETITRFR